MATGSKLTITVRPTRGGCTIAFRSNGRYISLTTNGISETLLSQPIQPTASETAFWTSVLAILQPEIASGT